MLQLIHLILSLRVKIGLDGTNVGMIHQSHNLQFSVLHMCVLNSEYPISMKSSVVSYFEALILQHFFDGSILSIVIQFHLINYAKRSISNNLLMRILKLNILSTSAVFCWHANRSKRIKRIADYMAAINKTCRFICVLDIYQKI